MAYPLKVRTQGDPRNPALVFLHAFPFSAAMWEDQIRLFSEKYYCLAPDLPGFGESAPPAHPVTFEAYADAVADYLKEAKIEKAVWCGLSMGGYLALRLFERSPDSCRALILCDTKAGADGNEAKLKRWSSIQAALANRTEFIETQWQALIGESSKNDAALRKRFEELMGKVGGAAIASGLVALATRTDSAPLLTKIKVPTLIVVGAEDKVTPPPEAEAMNKAIAGSRLTVLAGTGHLSNLEKPKEFNDALSAFLAAL